MSCVNYESISSIHALYVSATGLHLRLAYDRESAWARFLGDGFTPSDLLLVVAWIKKGIAKGERRENALLFRNLIESLDHFEEDLAVATAHARKPIPSARDREIALLRPTAPNQTSTTTASADPVAVVSAKALELLRACKASL